MNAQIVCIRPISVNNQKYIKGDVFLDVSGLEHNIDFLRRRLRWTSFDVVSKPVDTNPEPVVDLSQTEQDVLDQSKPKIPKPRK